MAPRGRVRDLCPGEVGRGRPAFPQDPLSSTDQCAEVLA